MTLSIRTDISGLPLKASLQRYDVRIFVTYSPINFTFLFILYSYCDGENNLWCISVTGFLRYERSSNSFREIKSASFQYGSTVFEDNTGTLWMLRRKGKLFFHNDGEGSF